MDDPGTESLRKLAQNWTLAGDEQLLSILQNTHQRLLSKCQEANCQLEQMATALNDASISLQNVNNQFMALSSSQFIESRVYDDDDVVTDVPAVKEPPKPELPDELSSLKRSISVLENAHEIINILHDSDTESDTDDEMTARMVLKPKDMYADRPLPYIIGSQSWKNKWHAGLLLEDSDTDSTTSKPEQDSEQYSQSEPEDTHTDLHTQPHAAGLDTTISETSSELPSEQGSIPKPTPSDVASEIARRLGTRDPPKMVERGPEYEEPAKPIVRKIYRPQDPVSSTIFPDEPPPLSDHSDSQESDIFADLHRSQPYAKSHLADDLFGFNENENSYEKDSDEGDIFSDFANKPVTNPSAKPTSLFDAGPAPHMFDKKHTADDRTKNIQDKSDDDRRHTNRHYNHHHTAGDGRTQKIYDKSHASSADDTRVRSDDQRDMKRSDAEVDRGVKKPVGGISLFGNKGTESIGAAILKRNQRKSSTSDDESGCDSRSEAHADQQIRKEKDIFDDLFARSEGKKVTKDKDDVVKNIKTEIQRKTEEKVKDKKVEKAKVDLFSDNLFDDIDDIFSTNVVKMPAKDNTKSKSIFEDDDDLFSEIAAPKPMKVVVASSSNNKKSLFDSDDELFSENTPKPDKKPKISEKATKVNKPNNITENSTKMSESPKINKSIFDNDEDDIFSDVKTNKLNEVTQVQNTAVSEDKHNDLSKGDEQISKNIGPPKTETKTSSNIFRSPSLFGDDDDETDIFTEPAKSSNIQNITAVHNKVVKETSYKIDKELSIKNEMKIPERMVDKNIEVTPSSSVKTVNFEQNVVKNENVDLNKDSSQTIENNVNKIVETRSIEDSNITVLPVSEKVDRKKSNSSKNNETIAAKIFDHVDKNIQNIEQSSSDTNNDFSDQDFDDLPPKLEETNKNLPINTKLDTEVKNNEEIHHIFDKNTLEDDIFAKSEQNTENSESIFKNIEPDFKETITQDFKKTEQDNKTNQVATKNIEADIFSDIITEPPVFEKPKEPKKSKNINALFDDDSDDESLFFKKNDPIFEENVDEFTPKQDSLFGIFADEPPDDDFSKTSDDLDDDMFCSLPKPKLPQNDNFPPIPDTGHFVDIGQPKSDNKIPEMENNDKVEDIFSTPSKTETKPVEEIPKIPVFYTNKELNDDIFKLPNTENVDKSPPKLEEQKSPTTLSDAEPFIKIPKNESKPSSLEKSFDVSSDDVNLSKSAPKLEKPSSFPLQQEVPVNNKQELVDKTSDDGLFSSAMNTEKPLLPENKIVKQDSDSISEEELFKTIKSVPKSENNQKPEEIQSPDLKTETKKVGKLKVGLNINVNALLPGASPKKAKPNDQTDGQTQSVVENKNSENKIYPEDQKSESKIPESQNTDSKLLKSVSFDGKPESDVLDNKLSKERAKIQVKRRPSTRRARKEAVRKSGIDFGEDSTDNSSSFDDPPRVPTEIQPDTSKNANVGDENIKALEDDVEIRNIEYGNIETSKMQERPEDKTIHAEIKTRIVEKQSTSQPEKVDKHVEITDKPTYSRDVKSKVVYILNDEDIFNTSPDERSESMNKNQIVNSRLKSENTDLNIGVTTLGKVYNKAVTKSENIKKDSKASLFGEEDDEEIFKAKTSVKKSTIFNSDSEEELFGTSSKKEVVRTEADKGEVKKEIKSEVVKGPLFGDEDDDDDDLFGVKTKKRVEQKPQTSRSTTKEPPKPAEPVFEDPLSMFSDDD